jgi:hypothetical protein
MNIKPICLGTIDGKSKQDGRVWPYPDYWRPQILGGGTEFMKIVPETKQIKSTGRWLELRAVIEVGFRSPYWRWPACSSITTQIERYQTPLCPWASWSDNMKLIRSSLSKLRSCEDLFIQGHPR